MENTAESKTLQSEQSRTVWVLQQEMIQNETSQLMVYNLFKSWLNKAKAAASLTVLIYKHAGLESFFCWRLREQKSLLVHLGLTSVWETARCDLKRAFPLSRMNAWAQIIIRSHISLPLWIKMCPGLSLWLSGPSNRPQEPQSKQWRPVSSKLKTNSKV